VEGENGEDLIPIEHPALFVAEHAAVAVAIVGDAEPRRVRPDHRRELLRVFAADAGVDIGAVRRIAQADHHRPEPAQTRAGLVAQVAPLAVSSTMRQPFRDPAGSSAAAVAQ
jgi:hypothetical protein